MNLRLTFHSYKMTRIVVQKKRQKIDYVFYKNKTIFIRLNW